MENLEEFEIINIEKSLEKERKSAIAGATLNTISSTIFMSLGIFYAYNHQLTPAILEGIASVGLGISTVMKMSEIKNINNKIKSLKK